MPATTPLGSVAAAPRAALPPALTIHQPYAELIASGAKRVENRTWATDYRGPLVIHAGKSRDWLDVDDDPDAFEYGAFVAVAELTRCLTREVIFDQDPFADPCPPELHWLRYHGHTNGPICWVLANVERLHWPISCPGHQRLWSPAAFAPAIAHQLPPDSRYRRFFPACRAEALAKAGPVPAAAPAADPPAPQRIEA